MESRPAWKYAAIMSNINDTRALAGTRKLTKKERGKARDDMEKLREQLWEFKWNNIPETPEDAVLEELADELDQAAFELQQIVHIIVIVKKRQHQDRLWISARSVLKLPCLAVAQSLNKDRL
jgi:hypothetical protein